MTAILRMGDPTPEPGALVALACPACDWRSLESVVLEQVNGAWFAYQAISDQWHRHWQDEHKPAPIRLVVGHENGSEESA